MKGKHYCIMTTDGNGHYIRLFSSDEIEIYVDLTFTYLTLTYNL